MSPGVVASGAHRSGRQWAEGVDLELTAKRFIADLERLGERVRMGDVFALAKTYKAMEPPEILKLLRADEHLARVGAVSIMDFEARDRRTDPERRRELYELYVGNLEKIDHWSLVDRAAPSVVGGYLWDKPRQALDDLARSPGPMDRRTAIVATYYFIRQHDLEDTFRIADILAHDLDELVQPCEGVARRMLNDELEGLVLKDRQSPYRDG